MIIGLTGGIGSGKTTVANLFAKKGIAIIDTDEIARQVVNKGTKAYNEIVKKFGKEILIEDESLNRAKLREIIFNNPKDKLWLENLLHPMIRDESNKQALAAKSPYSIIVIPLLAETEPNPVINRVLLVDATTEEQEKRSQKRDKLSKDKINAIIESQATRDQRIKIADDIINNLGNINDLIPQVEKLHKFYLSIAQ